MFKNVVVSYCRIGRISQASRVHGIAEDFNYFPILGHKHDGLAFRGNDPYISISIQCDSDSAFKIGMRTKTLSRQRVLGVKVIQPVLLFRSPLRSNVAFQIASRA